MANPVLIDNQFWLQVMGDHAIIIYESFSPLETVDVKKAEEFIILFNSLLSRARSEPTEEQTKKLISEALKATKDLRDFKMKVLYRQLTDHIRITLTTGVLNHFINEADEYIYILEHYANNTVPKFHPVHYNYFWLRNGRAHSNFIQQYLGLPYVGLSEQALAFDHKFQILFDMAMEFGDYLRTGLMDFSAIHQLNIDSYELNRAFAEFIVDLQIRVADRRVVIPAPLLVLDHMYREGCYFLTQLAGVSSDIKPPACDPAAPRKFVKA